MTVAFGTLFNNIRIKRRDMDGTAHSTLKVPLSRGNKQKWLRMVNERKQDVSVILPRMSFTGPILQYDSVRKQNTLTQHIKQVSVGEYDVMYQRVPYNFNYTLHIMTETLDDGYQILEQIFPYFDPYFVVTIKDISDMDITTDVSISLTGNNFQDNAEGQPEEGQYNIWTLDFTMLGYLYKPKKENQEVLQTLIINQYTGNWEDSDVSSAEEEQIFTLESDDGETHTTTREFSQSGYAEHSSSSSA